MEMIPPSLKRKESVSRTAKEKQTQEKVVEEDAKDAMPLSIYKKKRSQSSYAIQKEGN